MGFNVPHVRSYGKGVILCVWHGIGKGFHFLFLSHIKTRKQRIIALNGYAGSRVPLNPVARSFASAKRSAQDGTAQSYTIGYRMLCFTIRWCDFLYPTFLINSPLTQFIQKGDHAIAGKNIAIRTTHVLQLVITWIHVVLTGVSYSTPADRFSSNSSFSSPLKKEAFISSGFKGSWWISSSFLLSFLLIWLLILSTSLW